jgi:1-acyl-sn-glycerol-3-phosphate acyltransferase
MSAGPLVRSTVYALLQVLITLPYALLSVLTFPLPALTRYRFVTRWTSLMLRLAERVLGIRPRVLGRENIPPGPCVVLCKHQSAWETMALQEIFPPQVWLIKRELLWIPFFGWGLAMLSPIAIDRGSGMKALRQLVEQGKDRLNRGFWVVVFPEGTRTAPGQRGRYQTGGALLAAKAGVPVVPVALNAGEVWPRNAFVKHPGTVTVSIGPAIDTRNATATDITQRAEDWIEAEMQRISPHHGAAPPAA